MESLVKLELSSTLFALRHNDNSFLLSDKGWARHFETGWKKILRLTVLNPFLVYIKRGRLMANGIRRHSDDEIVEIAKGGFKTLTILLGDKPYFMGDKPGTVWAVLVAGSNGWTNYRHQADISHAYTIVRSHGIPPDHIITMMYDDIAYDPDNDWPGMIFHNQSYRNMYLGKNIDYRRKDVTPENFIGILKGTPMVAGKPVLKSTANDRVFVYFADHGAVGFVAFPDGNVLTASTLNSTLEYMYTNKMYSQLVIYIEACESGSMFEGILPTDRNIFALTAAWANESSYAYDCYNSRKLPCLGDEFSVMWMTDSDSHDIFSMAVGTQANHATRATMMSHVMRYGDLEIERQILGRFQGDGRAGSGVAVYGDDSEPISLSSGIRVPSWDAEVLYLRSARALTKSAERAAAIDARLVVVEKNSRRIDALVDDIVDKVVRLHAGDHTDTAALSMMKSSLLLEDVRGVGESINVVCHHKVATSFARDCVHFAKNTHALRYMRVLNNLCSLVSAEDILDAFAASCTTRI